VVGSSDSLLEHPIVLVAWQQLLLLASSVFQVAVSAESVGALLSFCVPRLHGVIAVDSAMRCRYSVCVQTAYMLLATSMAVHCW
jgi:hypothetical protein